MKIFLIFFFATVGHFFVLKRPCSEEDGFACMEEGVCPSTDHVPRYFFCGDAKECCKAQIAGENEIITKEIGIPKVRNRRSKGDSFYNQSVPKPHGDSLSKEEEKFYKAFLSLTFLKGFVFDIVEAWTTCEPFDFKSTESPKPNETESSIETTHSTEEFNGTTSSSNTTSESAESTTSEETKTSVETLSTGSVPERTTVVPIPTDEASVETPSTNNETEETSAEPTGETPTEPPSTSIKIEETTVEPTTEKPTEPPSTSIEIEETTVEPTTETPTEPPSTSIKIEETTVEPTTETPTEPPSTSIEIEETTVEPTTETPIVTTSISNKTTATETTPTTAAEFIYKTSVQVGHGIGIMEIPVTGEQDTDSTEETTTSFVYKTSVQKGHGIGIMEVVVTSKTPESTTPIAAPPGRPENFDIQTPDVGPNRNRGEAELDPKKDLPATVKQRNNNRRVFTPRRRGDPSRPVKLDFLTDHRDYSQPWNVH